MWISSTSSPLPFQYSFALLEYFFICPIIFQHFDFSSYTQIDWKIISAPYFKTQTFHILSNSFYILFLFNLLVQSSKEGALNLELWTWSFGLGALDLSSCYLLMNLMIDPLIISDRFVTFIYSFHPKLPQKSFGLI